MKGLEVDMELLGQLAVALMGREERLVLSANSITVARATAIVRVMGNKQSLETLDLNGSQLSEAAVEDMDKSGQLSSLSDDEPLPSDSEEEEEDTRKQVNAESTRAHQLRKLAKTTEDEKLELNFSGCGLKLDTEADAVEIIKQIDNCKSLNTLCLEGNTLGEDAAEAIGEALEKHKELERALWSNIFTRVKTSQIPGVLQNLGSGVMSAQAQLTELDLSNNAIGLKGMEGLTELLKSSSCYQLQVLRFSKSSLGPDGGKMLADSLLECRKNSSQLLELRVFACGNGRLENAGAIALAEAFKVMGSLEEVSMSKNNITSGGMAALADAFIYNPNLRVINMSDNMFMADGARSMAKVLPNLEKLEEINFGDCFISDEGTEAMAEGLRDGHLCLKRLVLSANDITAPGATAIARVMGNKQSLETLDLNGNHLGEEGIAAVTKLMRDMFKLDELSSFSKDDPVSSDSEEEEDTRKQVNVVSTQQSPLHHGDDHPTCSEKREEEARENGQEDEKEKLPPLNTSHISSLTDQLAKTTVDEKFELNFAGCGFKMDTEADVEKITQKIDSCPNLKSLRLEGNTLGVEAAKAIGKSLRRHPEFKMALWNDMFTGRLKSEIPRALQHLGSGIMSAQATLTELDLSDNAFGPNGMVGLTDLLKSSSCYRLQALKLNNNGLGMHGGKMLAECLLECHWRGCQAGTPLQLRVFVSGRGRLENDGAKALAEAFKVMGSLEEVSMPQNGINPKGIAALADAFVQNPNLRVINMNDNTLTVAGARSMAEALPHLSRLEEVNFGDCLVRNAGAEVLAEALTNGHQCLKRLILSFNEVKESGANAIAYAMAEKPALEKLDLDGNQLGEDGIRVVRATMESVDKLDLLGSFSDDEGIDSDEEDEDDEEEQEDEDDDDRENSCNSEAVNMVRSQVKDVTLTPHQDKTVTTKDFLLFPSPSKLKALGSHRADDIVSYLQEDLTDVDRAIDVFMKVSCVVVPDDKQTSKAAYECADAIFSTLFQSTDSSHLAGAVANSILVSLGLIKSEDKKFRPVSCPDGVLLVLEHAVRQNYFLKGVRDILHIFITRPHPALIECHRSRQNLLNTLSKWQ